jgi:hypothetical protein
VEFCSESCKKSVNSNPRDGLLAEDSIRFLGGTGSDFDVIYSNSGRLDTTAVVSFTIVEKNGSEYSGVVVDSTGLDTLRGVVNCSKCSDVVDNSITLGASAVLV